MNMENIKKWLTDILLGLFADKSIDAEAIQNKDLIDELGMDSISFIAIIIEIEAQFNVTIPDDKLMMDTFRNVDSIAQVIDTVLKSGMNDANDDKEN